MRKLFKKSLACVLAVALCLTAMVGVLSVSADVTGTITAADVEIASDATTVVIPVTFAVPAGELLSENFIDLAVTDGASISAIAVPADVDTDTEYKVVLGSSKSRFQLFTPADSTVSAATVEITVAIADITKAPFTLTVADFTSATDDMEIINYGSKDIAITVKKEHVHDYKETVTAPTCTTAGYTTYTCACGDTKTGNTVDALGHNYGDNLEYCANNCGTANPDYAAPGPVVVAAPEQLTHAVAIGDTFGVIFKFRESSISDEYASYRLDLKRTVNAGGFNFGYDTTSVTNFNDGGDDLIMAPTWYGFELFSLSAPIELTWHFFDKNGVEVAYSEPETTSLADIAVAYHDSNESGANMKKVMADMIQVGAAALNHFTANRTKKCDYSTLPVPTIDSPYTTTELGAFAEYNSAEGLSVKVAGALSTSAYFNMSFAENVANREQYRFEVTYYNAMKRREITEPIAGSTMKGDETTCMASLTNFPLFATNADVTFKLYKEGIEAPIAVNHYCMEQYYAAGLASNSGSATLKTLMRELGEMAQSIRKARNL